MWFGSQGGIAITEDGGSCRGEGDSIALALQDLAEWEGCWGAEVEWIPWPIWDWKHRCQRRWIQGCFQAVENWIKNQLVQLSSESNTVRCFKLDNSRWTSSEEEAIRCLQSNDRSRDKEGSLNAPFQNARKSPYRNRSWHTGIIPWK